MNTCLESAAINLRLERDRLDGENARLKEDNARLLECSEALQASRDKAIAENARLAGLLRSAVDALHKASTDAYRLSGVLLDCKARARAVTVAWKQADDLHARLAQSAHLYGLGIPAAGATCQPHDPPGSCAFTSSGRCVNHPEKQ